MNNMKQRRYGEETPPPKTFTQDEVNTIMATHKRQLVERTEQQATELEALRATKGLTEKQRTELESRIDQLKNEHLSKEELAIKDREKLITKYDKEVAALKAQEDGWKTKYTEATIEREITDAASTAKAYRPKQIISILRNNTYLTEALDEDGKPNGAYNVRVKFSDQKDGKPITLDLSPQDAIKRMSEMEDFANLFNVDVKSGFGGSGNRESKGKLSVEDISKMSIDEYKKAKAAGQLAGFIGGK